ncbi:MAG TPA: hypothetical protein VKM55_03870 [Candidatus Lokiarchaeia archaeon]|nr:hypothetical protein [Candidatus Lokiarchaeia archaeon]
MDESSSKPNMYRYLLFAFAFSYFIVFWSLSQVLFYDASIVFTYFTFAGSILIGLMDYRLINKKSPIKIQKTLGWNLAILCVLSITLAMTFNRTANPLFKNTHPPEVDPTSFFLETLEISLFFVFLNALAFILVFLAFQGNFVSIKGLGTVFFRLMFPLLLISALCSLACFMLANLDLESIFLLGIGLQSTILVLIGHDLHQDDLTGHDQPRSELETAMPSKTISTITKSFFAVLDASICIALALILPTFLNGNIIDVASMGSTFLLAMPFLAVAVIVLGKFGVIKIAGIMSIANGLLVIYLGFFHAQDHELTICLCSFILGNGMARLFLLPSLFSSEKDHARGARSAVLSLTCLIIISCLLDVNSSRFFTANSYIIPPAGFIIGIVLCVIGCFLLIESPMRRHEKGGNNESIA